MIRKVCWNITSRCNRNCSYCFKFNERDLSLKDNLYILNKLGKLNVQQIMWSGGEPFLYKDFSELLKKSHEKGILNYVNTNATLLDIANIKETLLYIDKIIISLDFINDDLNLKNGIGIDYFKHVKELLINIKRINKNIELQVNTVLFSKNINLIDNLYHELLKYDIDDWKIIRFFPIRGEAYDERYSLGVSDEDFEKIRSKYLNTKQKFKIVIHGKKEMSEKHYIVLSSGLLVSSKNGKDIIMENLLKGEKNE